VTYKHAPKGKPRRVAGTMNKLEQAYSDVLAHRVRQGEIAWFKYEGVTFRLGQDCRYTPDFMVMTPDGGIELHETKGFMQDDALVKIKACVAQYPFPLVIVTKDAKKDGGAWRFRRIEDDLADAVNTADRLF